MLLFILIPAQIPEYIILVTVPLPITLKTIVCQIETSNCNTVFTRLPCSIAMTQDIHRDATLFVDGHCEDDVKQGSLGNCWFVASVACFGLHEKLVREVLPVRALAESPLCAIPTRLTPRDPSPFP